MFSFSKTQFKYYFFIQDENITESERIYYLMEKDLKLFVGKLVVGAEVVHNVQLQGSQRKFEILKLVEAENWSKFDKHRHIVGAFKFLF